MEACDLLSVEIALDRVEAELAVELPAHLRAVASAYARGDRMPLPPAAMLRAATLETARRALPHPVLADRGLALLRLVAPAVIDTDPAVAAALGADATWPALAALAAARDAAATLRLGRTAIALVHALHGTRDVAATDAALPPPIAGWHAPDGIVLDRAAISQLWDRLRSQHGIDGAVRFEPSATARPRTFVIAPRAEVVVVIPAQVATPVARFAVVHELGHVLAALVTAAGMPRVLDEAAAAYIARAVEVPGALYSPLAAPARVRRLALARVLDAIERALPAFPPDVDQRVAARPPWALWHDPGAQAAYVAAEALADRLADELGPEPRPGAFAAALAAHRDEIDRRFTL